MDLTVVARDGVPAPFSVINTVVATGFADNQIAARAQVRTDLTWCFVRLNDGPVGSDLQAVIYASSLASDVVKVSGYCLVRDLTINRTLTLQGGWNIDFSDRDVEEYTTILGANWQGNVLRLNYATPTVEGFHVSDGWGGIIVNYGSPTIQNNAFSDNWISSVSSFNGSPSILNNTFRNNWALGAGAGIYNSNGNPVIQNNSFSDNTGSGIYSVSGNPVIRNNMLMSNTAVSSGSIFIASGSPTIQNNILSDNAGSGIYNDSGSPIILNNTLSGNTASGIYDISVSPTTVLNNILSGNSIGIFGGSSQSLLNYNNVWNNSNGNYIYATPGTHDISADPMFANPAAGDFHLTADSPCIDAADPDNYPTTDFEGDPRPLGLAPDIGADEHPATSPCCDFDGDGTVDVDDIVIIVGFWNQPAGEPYDQDGDGMITIVDIQRVARWWGVAVP